MVHHLAGWADGLFQPPSPPGGGNGCYDWGEVRDGGLLPTQHRTGGGDTSRGNTAIRAEKMGGHDNCNGAYALTNK